MQNDLLDLGADLSVPAPPADDTAAAKRERERLRIGPAYTEWLEQACDEVNATLPPLRSFVIPGGTPASAQLHVCRTVCRRAERRAIAVGEEINPEVVRYLNRLSDLLFILGRAVNARSDGPAAEEPLWAPGTHPAPRESSATRAPPLARARARLGQRLGGAQRGDGERHPQTRHEEAADHVARHVPGEDQQRHGDGDRVGAPTHATGGRQRGGATSTALSTSASAAVA